MKPYGLPREVGVEFPDVGDVQNYALKTSAGRVKGSKNENKSYTRNTENRKRVRRQWKKKGRATAKVDLKKEMNNEVY